MAAHLNINSLRYKFDEIKEVLTDNIVDLLIISETKLDESFNVICPSNQPLSVTYIYFMTQSFNFFHSLKIVFCWMEINSLRYKFDEIKEVLTDNIVDLLIISETKLDESFK
jgi:peptide subunit release factor 1 (eRF1)